jgi:Zinc carboxypeptidase/Cytosolic carboxypeptidase N-terminal domain
MLLLAFAITVTSNFEGGSIGKVEHAAPAHLRCAVEGQTDQAGRNRQANWYYFRVDGAKGVPLTIDLVNLPGEYNFKPNRGAVQKDTIPHYSYDRRTWLPVEQTEFDAQEPRMRIKLTPASNKLWIAHTPPYTGVELKRMLDRHKLKPEVIGKSVEGRDLYLLTIGSGKKVIWLMTRQHSWESFTSWVGEGFIDHLLLPAGAKLRQQATFKIIPICDPDGMAHGGVRFNRHGFDLNRNWDVTDPQRMPEITAQRNAIFRWLDSGKPVDLFLSLHNTETAEYIDGSASAKEMVARVYQILTSKTTFSPTRPPQIEPTTADTGRMNVVQGLERDRKLRAMLMEQRITFNPKLNRIPTIDDRKKFGAQLAEALVAALE